eukprot:Plantae.Rhodophyta-Hildenbrandia_rubra.ctg1215.p1 GENE.Plantae.Rhodophyta-Hildenbrandia_rubra.ctg1215~~Plantae.Rhodophyta-Hildenbrandia_rubra.ctg1215.p1  ORF type:complete len:414 (-),score=61.92 Plantae.Rhodophyta-Hildenbrandia_rubra.ctg1215:1109-2350(-)
MIHRRSFSFATAALFFTLCATLPSDLAYSYFKRTPCRKERLTKTLLIGSYTQLSFLPTASGKGITKVELSGASARIVRITPSSETGSNPAYLAARGRNIFVANENENVGVSTRLRLRENGILKRGGAVNASSPSSTHIATVGRKGVVTANFGGSITSFLETRDGGLQKVDEFVFNTTLAAGSEFPFEAPHPHQIVEYNGDLLAPDLGSNSLWRFSYDARDGKLSKQRRLVFREGDGPRHLAIHPFLPIIYLVLERSNTLVELAPSDKSSIGLVVTQRIDMLKSEEEGTTGAAVRVSEDGRFVYVSLRIPDKEGVIAGYSLGPNGKVGRQVGLFKTGGETPRDFLLVENVGPEMLSLIIAANQGSDSVVIKRRNKSTGVIEEEVVQELQIGTPTAILQVRSQCSRHSRHTSRTT